MANVRLGTKAVGSIVKIKVNGASKDFIVVQQGNPNTSTYDSSCAGTWLLMKDIYTTSTFGNNNSYKDSSIHTYLNGTFYNLIDSNIRAAIKQAKIPYQNGTGSGGSLATGSNGLSTKVFLLSGYEVGWTTSDNGYFPKDGVRLAYFDNSSGGNSKRVAYNGSSAAIWWLRSPYASSNGYVWDVGTDGSGYGSWYGDSYGVRPAFILPSTLFVSNDGTVSTNTAPSTPGSISVPSPIMGGSTLVISWTAASDSDGNLAGYILERSTNGGSSWSKIYQGTATRTTNVIKHGTSSVMYRVKAYDTEGLESAYKTSPKITIINNAAPVIITSSSTLGEKNAAFSWTYTVTDADGDTLTVTEKLDGKTTATRTGVASGTALTFGQAADAAGFQRILNGSHTLTVEVSDGKETTSASATFTKAVHAASVTLAEPLTVEGDITVAVLQMTGSIPDDAVFKAEVTNNDNDPSPVWQDATTEVKKGVNIVFTNSTAANGAAFNFRISVSRGASGTGGYIESVSGAFQ